MQTFDWLEPVQALQAPSPILQLCQALPRWRALWMSLIRLSSLCKSLTLSARLVCAPHYTHAHACPDGKLLCYTPILKFGARLSKLLQCLRCHNARHMHLALPSS